MVARKLKGEVYIFGDGIYIDLIGGRLGRLFARRSGKGRYHSVTKRCSRTLFDINTVHYPSKRKHHILHASIHNILI